MGFKRKLHIEDETLEKLLLRKDYVKMLPELQELSREYDSGTCGACGGSNSRNKRILLETRLVLVKMSDGRKEVLKKILGAGTVELPYKDHDGSIKVAEF